LITWNRFEELQKVIRRVSPHVDRTVVVDGDSRDGSLEWLRSTECTRMNVEVFVHPWQDDFIKQRNYYIQHAGQDGWLLTTDTDELLEDSAAYSIKNIVASAESQEATLCRFRAHDIHVDENGKVNTNLTNYYEPMLFKLGKNVRYTGILHHSLHKLPGKTVDFPEYRYYHVKSIPNMWFHGARNYWHSAGVGKDKRDGMQEKFRKLCTAQGIKYFHELAEMMRARILPEPIIEWLKEHRDHGNPEIRAYFNCYYVFMHPDLNWGMSNMDFPFQEGRKSTLKGMHF